MCREESTKYVVVTIVGILEQRFHVIFVLANAISDRELSEYAGEPLGNCVEGGRALIVFARDDARAPGNVTKYGFSDEESSRRSLIRRDSSFSLPLPNEQVSDGEHEAQARLYEGKLHQTCRFVF